jgi:hypothetical protein
MDTSQDGHGYSFAFMELQLPPVIDFVFGEAILSFRWDPVVRDNIRGYVEGRVELRLRKVFERDINYGYEGLILAGAEHFKVVDRVMEKFNQRFSLLEQIAFAASEDERTPEEVILGRKPE